MSHKSNFELLRGESITVFSGDLVDIPCIETSDINRLCKHPVVSVHMITYNHEHYIRQAIEGVMMQKTDFEFELVIGEDCSRDKTRDICFEYQKKYPDKIRVLWWHENVSCHGGNGNRVTAHCRGDFIAFCEGDDYWTDTLKLQKQVEILRNNPDVSLCFARARVLNQESGQIHSEVYTTAPVGLLNGKEFAMRKLFANVAGCNVSPIPNSSVRTLTAVVRKSTFMLMLNRFGDIFSMALKLSDTTMWLGCSFFGAIYFMSDVVANYRMNPGGITKRDPGGLLRDGTIVRIYYAMEMWGCSYPFCLDIFRDMLFQGWICQVDKLAPTEQKKLACRLDRLCSVVDMSSARYSVYGVILKFGLMTRLVKLLCDYFFYHYKKKNVLLINNLDGYLDWKGY